MKRTALARRTPLRRAVKRAVRTTDPIPRKERKAVEKRSGGWCELGCRHRATHMHHRKLRRHGDHRAVNLIHVCAEHHHIIHASPDHSMRLGWLVPSWEDPALVPWQIDPYS